AEDVAALAGQGDLPRTLAVTAADDAVVQVVDDAGRVIAASTNVESAPRLATFQPRDREPVAHTINDLPIADHEKFRVLALRTASAAGPLTVYVATILDPVTTTWAILRGIVLVGYPLLAAVAAD